MVDQTAGALIGADDPASDWMLRPGTHAKALPPGAGALARVLGSQAVKNIMARYTEADTRAVAAQAVYKRRSRQAIYARLVAILIGGLFLMPLTAILSAAAVKVGLIIQYACIAAALGLAAYLGAARLFSRWMEARAEAELARLALFDLIVDAEEPSREGELPILPLRLEYFRRYQLDVQCRYYLGRGREHERAAGQSARAVWWLNIFGALTFLPIIIVAADYVGLIDFSNLVPYLSFMALGTAVSGILGAMAAISSMNLDERNAARYLVVHENLKDLSGKSLEEARAAAARGDAPGVKQFAAAVQRLILAEHQEWIVLRNHIRRPEHLVRVALDPVRIGMPGQ